MSRWWIGAVVLGAMTLSTAASAEPRARKTIYIPKIVITGPNHVIVAVDIARVRPSLMVTQNRQSFAAKAEEAATKEPF